ncbi:MAG: hypothetical protein GF401_10145 [Chitinivibrionales bacterium]|nr:hypothetical protein [Chitinivibrionales bacterium]
MRKFMILAAGLLIPLSGFADHFSFEISINTPIREWRDDYHDCDLVEVKEVTKVHVFSCGRRVRKHRVVYYNGDLECYVYGPWYFGVELHSGCSCGRRHRICRIQGPRRHIYHPRRTKHIYIHNDVHRGCRDKVIVHRNHGHRKKTVIHHNNGSHGRKSCTVIHSSSGRKHKSSSKSVVVKRRSVKPVSSGTIHHANSRGPARKVTKSSRKSNRVVELGSNSGTYKAKRIKKW